MIFSTIRKEDKGCCTPQPKGKVQCPTCKEKAKGVLAKTLKALLEDIIKSELSCFDGFYYCKTASCKTVYFKDAITFTQKDISVIVGLKDGANPATVCYCFDWTKDKIKSELEKARKTIAIEDIKAKMQNPGCSCEVLNPSGGCCLSDITKTIKELKTELNLSV